MELCGPAYVRNELSPSSCYGRDSEVALCSKRTAVGGYAKQILGDAQESVSPNETDVGIMLAVAANTFNEPSETFIRGHAQQIAPSRTVVLCHEDGGAVELGCPSLSDLRGLAKPRHFGERAVNSIRFRWWRYVDPALRGVSEARVRAFLLRHNVGTVLAEYGPNGSLLRLVCKRAEIPLFVHFHGMDATKLARIPSWQRHYRKLFRDAAGIIAPSKFLADRLHDLGCPKIKIHVSPNGIDHNAFTETCREPGRILAVGRLVEKKAPHLTVRAFAEVQKACPGCTLDVVGDGPLRDATIAETKRHGLSHAVRLHGAREPGFVRSLLNKAELFVQHSVTAADGDMESFGISLVEAMASSIPIVATDHNGFAETVSDGETGLLVAEHDVEGMSEAMVTLLKHRSRAKAMGRAGRARVEANFTQDRTAKRLREIMNLETYL